MHIGSGWRHYRYMYMGTPTCLWQGLADHVKHCSLSKKVPNIHTAHSTYTQFD
jgi:hypothetical protein